MREDYYPREDRYPRAEYYPQGYRDDEEMYVFDQCCENCARQRGGCPFVAYVNCENAPKSKRKAMKEDAVIKNQELQWCIHWKQIKRRRF